MRLSWKISLWAIGKSLAPLLSTTPRKQCSQAARWRIRIHSPPRTGFDVAFHLRYDETRITCERTFQKSRVSKFEADFISLVRHLLSGTSSHHKAKNNDSPGIMVWQNIYVSGVLGLINHWVCFLWCTISGYAWFCFIPWYTWLELSVSALISCFKMRDSQPRPKQMYHSNWNSFVVVTVQVLWKLLVGSGAADAGWSGEVRWPSL